MRVALYVGAGMLVASIALAVAWIAIPPTPPPGWNDPNELEATWAAARTRRPGAGAEGDLAPLVIYLHGCAGFWSETDDTLDLLAEHGYAAIAPDGFARSEKPRSCDFVLSEGGLDRSTLRLRQAEARYAIDRARTLDWVDPERIYLLGFSQGATAVATLELETPVAGRIIEAWTCHSPWLEYRGLAAANDEPHLALLAAGDRWYASWWLRGDCGAFMASGESRSVVYADGELSESHHVLWHPTAQRELLDFLDAR